MKYSNHVIHIMLAGLMLMNVDLGPKVPEAHHERERAPAHIANPHLHGARPELERVRRWDRHLAGHWYGHWSYANWVSLHRGLGNVQGKVVAANGSPVEGFTVTLRGANGAFLKPASRRHTQISGAGGSFVMARVRAGHYRVRAAKGALNKHTTVYVRAGQTSTAVVRM